MIFMINFIQLGTKIMNNEKYRLYLNEVRKNLDAPGKQLLSSPKSAYFWCSTTYIHVGDLDQSPLIGEPLNKSYGDHWLLAQFGIKARLRRHAVACQEIATLSPDSAGSPGGRVLKHVDARRITKAMALVLGEGCNAADACFRARPPGLPAQFGLASPKAPTFGATSCQAEACMRSRALIPNCAESQRSP